MIQESPLMHLCFEGSIPNIQNPLWMISMLVKKFTCPPHRIVQIYRLLIMENGWLGNVWLHGLEYKRAMYEEIGFLCPLCLKYKYFCLPIQTLPCCQ